MCVCVGGGGGGCSSIDIRTMVVWRSSDPNTLGHFSGTDATGQSPKNGRASLGLSMDDIPENDRARLHGSATPD